MKVVEMPIKVVGYFTAIFMRCVTNRILTANVHLVQEKEGVEEIHKCTFLGHKN